MRRFAIYRGQLFLPDITRVRQESASGQYVDVSEVLSQTGYATSMSGKWHLGVSQHGRSIGAFTSIRGDDRRCQLFRSELTRPTRIELYAGPKNPFVHNDKPVRSVPSDYYATDAFADHAIQQIQTFRRGRQTFFYSSGFYRSTLSASSFAKGHCEVPRSIS